ncbi:transposase [Chryseobacterium sp. MEBOG07]|uniref:transposase n=1 Tax=Chryseobacterium sp. MEBOG07 TaxID=2879939 RepID=UPI001F23EFC1|nr:transposase [Chryseobacterium sp. MEBOG07]UKB78330.1 transposase [Chryseobacterium sp. MEBOG07]
MIFNFKDIHIGSLIKERVNEIGIETPRICKFLNCNTFELEAMYEKEDLNSKLLLRWSKLLEYDFFRLYSHHLILYAPQTKSETSKPKTALPVFRKNIYTRNLINYILELIDKKEKTPQEIIDQYRIPKTTLYKWIDKYENTKL